MDHLDDFKTLRRYTRLEAAHMLSIPDTWLKRWGDFTLGAASAAAAA